MARDQITVDLMLATKQAEREINRINRKLGDLGKTMGRALGGGGGGGDKVRALGTGLSKATVKADEFSKSMEASNARVIAFGASAGLIMQIDRALKAMVSSAIKVEKAMMDLNIVMDASTKQLERFGKGMFKVAKETAQSFDTVAEASTELARQGLGMEKTLLRTKDALILTRLTGMNAADSVKSLTAAVNSFNKEGVTSAQVINRMAKVDAKFAVSSEDLAKAISRVGASAVSAGVNMNELMAITTAVQQRTARGGAVIGNAFKTIFTRIQRTDVQKRLRDLGVATQDMNGKMLSGIQVLQNLADQFTRLSKAQQSSISENVAGVFQVNILKSALADLSSQTSNYSGALRAANTATDEAYQKNEKLNQTLDSLVNRTMANLTQAGSSLGGSLFGPAIQNTLGLVNNVIEAFGDDGRISKVGKDMGSALISGIGSFIGGPGLVLVTAVFGKIAMSLGKFATSALKDVLNLNQATKQRAALEEIVVNTIAKEPALLAKVNTGTLNVLTTEKKILDTIRLSNAERAKIAAYSGPITTALTGRGVMVSSSGRAIMRGGPGKASGFVPNFANPNAERAAAAAGGYKAGAIKTMKQPGGGTMMYNSAETVKRFPGMSQSAIMPPEGSPAGAGYRAAFSAAHGFNPYAASGFVPNFAPKKKTGLAGATTIKASNKIGVLLGEGPSTTVGKDYTQLLFGGPKDPTGKGSIKGLARMVPKSLVQDYKNNLIPNPTIKIKDVATRGIFPLESGKIRKTGKSTSFNDEFQKMEKGLGDFAGSVRNEIFGGKGGSSSIKNVIDFMGGSAKGEIFEASVRAALKQDPKLLKGANKQAPFDFNPGMAPDKDLLNLFGLTELARIEAKIGGEAATNIVSKYVNEFGDSDPAVMAAATNLGQKASVARAERGKLLKGRGRAEGFIPNFSPLTNALGRELQAGVPASAIRIGSSPALKSAGNPGGIGVYNTIDEPMGLSQGIRRSRNMGINPRGHGAAEGFVPNFMFTTPESRKGLPGTPAPTTGADGKLLSEQQRMHKEAMKEAKMTRGMLALSVGSMASSSIAAAAGPDSVMGKISGVMGDVAGYAGMGMMAGPKGAIAGAVAGLGIGIYNLMSASDEATKEVEKQKEAQESLAAATQRVTEALNQQGGAMGGLGIISKRDAALKEVRGNAEFSSLKMGETEEFQSLKTAKTQKEINTALAGIGRRAEGRKRLAALGETIGGIESRRRGDIRQRQLTVGMMDPSSANKRMFIPGITGSREKQRLAEAFGLDNIGMRSPREQLKAARGNLAGANLLRNNLGIDRKKYYRGMAAGGGNLSDLQDAGFALSQGSNVKLENILGAITGENAADTTEQADRIRKLLEASGEDLQKFKIGLVENFSNLEMLAKAEKELEDIEKARLGEIQKTVDANKPYIDSIIAARRELITFTQGAAESHALTKQDIAARKQLLGVNQQIAKARVSATSTAREMITLDRRQGRRRAIKERGLAFEAAEADRSFDLVKNLSGTTRTAQDNLLKSFGEGKLAGTGASGRTAAMEASSQKVRSLIEEAQTASPEELAGILARLDKRRGKLKAQSSGVAGNLSPELAAELASIEAVVPKIEEAANKESIARKVAAAKAEDDSKMANKRFKLALQQYENQFKLNTRQRQVDRLREATLKQQEVIEAKTLRSRGQMGARGFSSVYSASLAGDVAARGVQKGDFNRAFRAGFVNEMGYEPVDALREFEDGSRTVAQNMKSSFADAFQSISSGANSVQGALANMAQSILNSISQISSSMFSNMLFSSMGFDKFGKYAQGGVVTGGSGYKDDVPTLMQGGEFVIKKSSAQKIGYETLNAINNGVPGYSNGGPAMWKVGALAAGASAASGALSSAMAPGSPDPLPSRDYGQGRGRYGFFGGADPDGGQTDMVTGGAGRAGVSLSKGFVYYRRDPQTGRLISEKARPTEGRFEVSQRLSLLGRLGADDPQTQRMFQKEERLSRYQDYLATETRSRKEQVDAVKRQKRGRLMSAYMNAAMLIGGAKLMQGRMPESPDVIGSGGKTFSAFEGSGGTAYRLSDAEFFKQNMPGGGHLPFGTMESMNSTFDPFSKAGRLNIGGDPMGGANGGLAMVMGGEYVMSPQAVRTYGTNFMHELNRGNVPSYANGGPVGGVSTGNQGQVNGGSVIGGNTTNNVKINVNIDKNGKPEISASSNQSQTYQDKEGDREEIENNKALGKILQGVVLDEIVKQQRPGGLLQNTQ